MTTRRAGPLETVWVEVPEAALEAYEAALGAVCDTVGFFLDETTGRWRVEGVKSFGEAEAELAGALALAEAVSGIAAGLQREPTAVGAGWRTPAQCSPNSSSAGDSPSEAPTSRSARFRAVSP